MKKEGIKAALWGSAIAGVTLLSIVIGSRNLSHFDAALVCYTFALLFATFGITYRYAMWLQRPPTLMYWKRGWQLFFHKGYFTHNIKVWIQRVSCDFALNRFIYRRNRTRGITHMLIMWGCITAFLITLPLVFGWLHFDTLPGDLEIYQAYVFGFPFMSFKAESLFGFIIFHGLVWSSFLVILGVVLAMRRRVRNHDASTLQMFGEDFLPLVLLFAVSITGLMLTASYTWMHGYGYEFLALLHAITVIFTLLWLPFGKFFHIFQRPAQLGVSFFREIAYKEGKALCLRCGKPYASQMQVEDLKEVEASLGFNYTMKHSSINHYQHICPQCRRKTVGIAQGIRWHGQPTEQHVHSGGKALKEIL